MKRAVAAVAVGLLAAACGSGGASSAPVPVRVADFVPGDGITLTEERGVDERLARAGDDALVGAARLWRLERDGRVVGALQVATWDPDVPGDDAARASLLAAVHTGRPERRAVDGVTVNLSVQPAATGDTRPGLTRASWFTPTGFAVLTLRQDLDADPILDAAVAATDRPQR